MKTGEVGIFAERAGHNKCWHSACFTCAECNEILVDLIYFYSNSDNKIYCGRHHAEKLKPRCAACDEVGGATFPIHTPPCTHTHIQTHLLTHTHTHTHTHPYTHLHAHTHTHTHTHTHHTHMQLILCAEYTRAEDSDWHLDHFCCLRCDRELGGEQYRPQEGMPFCLPCYEIAFATICEVRCNCVYK